MNKTEALQIPSLVLAYMGDAVYEMYIREYVINQGMCKNGILHKKSIKYVSAKSQANILMRLEEILTEDEKDVVRRGRNANPHSHAKNADIIEYKHATGFEALIGYLYLSEQKDRLLEVLAKCVENHEKQNKNPENS